MINKNNFYGELHDVKAGDFYKCLNHNLKTDDEREQSVMDMFYPQGRLHPFWEDVFFQPEASKGNINLLLNSKDTQYSESNIALVLNAVGTYLLEPHMNDKKDETKYKIYTDYRMFKEATRSMSYDQLTEGDSEFFDIEGQMLFYKENINYKKEIKQVITPEDYTDLLIGSTMMDYRRASDELTQKKEAVRYYKTLSNEQINELNEGFDKCEMEEEDLDSMGLTKLYSDNYMSNFDYKESPSEFIENEKKKAGLYNKHKGLMQRDMLDIKDMLKKPIYFKQVTNSHTPDNEPEFTFDYWDMELIRLLAKIELGSCKYDSTRKYVKEFDNAYDKVKETMSDGEIELFELWREDGNIQEYADSNLLNDRTAHKRVKYILVSIQRQMIENYELDYYYTEIVKGKWKTCSKCGETKIASEYYFNKEKKSKDGFQAHCKVCNAERQKNE